MSMSDFSSLSGQLLVSLPTMQGDYFSHSVTLLIEHNSDGAFRLVINKPLTVDLAELGGRGHRLGRRQPADYL